ncbi:MAG: CapA family protein, partial [Pseudomonadales bacterium]|nr:CapA family protein [Pseudomonadales bacterium]
MQPIAAAESESGFNSGTLVVAGGDLHFGESYAQTARVLRSDKKRYQDSLNHLRALTTRGAFSFVNLETPLSLPRDNNDALEGKDYIH